MPKKNATIHARIPDELRVRLDRIHKTHLTNDSTVAVNMMEAFCEYVEGTGTVKFPVKLIPAPETKTVKRAS
jgi:L-ribulose-5-phosphate 3-epimerase UlaE